MAQQVLVQLVDDLDGSSATDISTIKFGLDGVEYEIDLTETNAERLRTTLSQYSEAGRRTGGRLQRGIRPTNTSSGQSDAAQIRAWAAENGYELAARGRIPAHVSEAYTQAQEVPAPRKTASKRSSSRTKKA